MAQSRQRIISYSCYDLKHGLAKSIRKHSGTRKHTRGPGTKAILDDFRVASADGRIRQAVHGRIRTSRPRLTPIDDIRSGFPTRVLQGLGNQERQTLRKQQAQEAAVELPQPILHPIRTRQFAFAAHGILRFVMRKQPIHQERVDRYYDQGCHARDEKGHRD